jgi:hypothetical protein
MYLQKVNTNESDMKDSFYKELECVFNQLLKYYVKILLGDFNATVGRDVFKPTTGNVNLHEISNDNGVRVVNFAMSKNLTPECTMFPHHNWTSQNTQPH